MTRITRISIENDTLVLYLWMVTKINQYSQMMSAALQIIENLGAMAIVQVLHCFYFKDDFIEAQEVRNVFLLELHILIKKTNGWLD